MEEELDTETVEQVQEDEELALFLQGKGWQIAKAKLMQRLLDAASILGLKLEGESCKTCGQFVEVKARERAVEMVINWLDEIQGTAQGIKSAQEELKEAGAQEFIEVYG